MRFLINSSNRDISNYPNSNSFRLVLPNSFNYVHYVRLEHFSIVGNYYNINISNNVFTFREGINLIVLNLKLGSYSATDLASTLTTAMNLATLVGNIYSVTLDNISGRLSFRVTGGAFINFTIESAAATFPFYELGFYLSQKIPAPAQTPALFINPQYPVHLNEPMVLFMRIKEFSDSMSSTGQSNPNAFFYVPLGKPFEEVIYKYNSECNNTLQFKGGSPAFSTLTIDLVDSNGIIQDLNNSDWLATLYFYFASDIID